MKVLLIVLIAFLSSVSVIGQTCTKIQIINSDTIFINPDKIAQLEKGTELFMGWIKNNLNQELKNLDEDTSKQVFVSFVMMVDYQILK